MLTIMCGYPGSGKSTYLEKVYTQNTADTAAVILCPDDFRLVLTGKTFHGPAEDSVWSHVKVAARVLLKGNHHVIIDATHLTIGSRGSWLRLAKEIGVQIDCYWLNVSPETARERNTSRQAHIRHAGVVPDDVMDRMISGFIVPTTDEGFWRVLKLCNDESVMYNEA